MSNLESFYIIHSLPHPSGVFLMKGEPLIFYDYNGVDDKEMVRRISYEYLMKDPKSRAEMAGLT